MTDFKGILEKIKKDEDLKKQFAAAVKDNKAIEFLNSIGCNTTREEIETFIKTKKGELSDDDLANVSGGCGTITFTAVLISVVFLGGGCAACTLINKGFESKSSCIT